MTQALNAAAGRRIEALFAVGTAAGLSDRQLLERYVAARDEAAFTALVERHGPMVLGVLRQLLSDGHDAEDAFQAAFLVLARRAHAIRDPDLLGNWLYGVATRTARNARKRRALARRGEEGQSAGRAEASPDRPAEQAAIERERAEALHAEIDRLPATTRLAVVLCYLEGLSLAEAAKRLRCPVGTVHSRLGRAREVLRRGLIRRGFAMSAATTAALLEARPARASVPPLLCDSTARAAIAFAGRPAAGGALSTPAAASAREVLRTMLIHRLESLALAVLLVASLAAGAVSLSVNAATPSWESEPKVQAAWVEPHPPDEPRPGPGRMFVAGRVLDPQGRPIASAAVDVVGRPRSPWVATRLPAERRVLVGRGETGPDGRFRLDAARTASTRFFEVDTVAAAPGYGVGWARLNPDAETPAAEITIRPEQVVHARAVDIKGQPAAGITLWVCRVGRFTDQGTFEGVNLGEPPTPEGLRAWPRRVQTDRDGRITLAGVGPDVSVGLVAHDPRFAHQWLNVQTDNPKGPGERTLVLRPATIIEGRILAADTGSPIPDAAITVAASQREFGSMYSTHFRADGQGRYTANPSPGTYFRVDAHPPEGQPYLIFHSAFAWKTGTVQRKLDLRLPRGVLIRGQVTDERTGRPLAEATVQYLAARRPDTLIDGWEAVVATGDDGSFRIAVAPGKGHLFVYGPTADYVLESIGSNQVYRGQTGGHRYYAHKIVPYEFKAGDDPGPIAVALRPGTTVKGHIVGPEGQTVDQAEIIALLHFNYFHLEWRGDITVHARDGRFELHGLDPEKTTPAYFLDADHEWGATVELSGRHAGADVTVRLQPNGRAKARFVGPDGQPVAKIFPHFEILGSPGPNAWSEDPKDRAQLAADAAYLPNVDRKHYWSGRGPVADGDGRIALPDLIPGATYRITDRSEPGKPRVRKDFTVQPGETVDLGDVRIERPKFPGG